MAKVVAKLWPDTFVNHFQPNVGMAAVTALEDAGWRVEIPAGDLCCGLTWVSTGQLGVAKKVLSRTVARLAEPAATAGALADGAAGLAELSP